MKEIEPDPVEQDMRRQCTYCKYSWNNDNPELYYCFYSRPLLLKKNNHERIESWSVPIVHYLDSCSKFVDADPNFNKCSNCKYSFETYGFLKCRVDPPKINEDGSSIFPKVKEDSFCSRIERKTDRSPVLNNDCFEY